MSSLRRFWRLAARRPHLSGLWLSPDFRYLWAAETVSQLGTQLSLVVIP